MRWKRICSAGLFAASIAMMVYGGYEVGGYIVEERQVENLHETLVELHSETGSVGLEKLESDSGLSTDEPQTSSYGIESLKAVNPDCVGWLKIEGTVIDYPVMYRPSDMDYYLYRDFYGRKSANGSLYISEICNLDSDNNIIYGHHMRSGKMFASLKQYRDQSFYEDHRYIIFETLNGTSIYEVMFALTTPVYTDNDFEFYNFADAEDETDFNRYISECSARALYDTGVTATYGDHLLTLCTCEYSQDNGRLLVVAKQIQSSGGMHVHSEIQTTTANREKRGLADEKVR